MNITKKSKNKSRGFGSQSKQLRKEVASVAQFLIDIANGAKPQGNSQHGVFYITNAYVTMLNIPPEELLRQFRPFKTKIFYDLEQDEQVAVLKRSCNERESRYKQQLAGQVIDELSSKVIELNAVASTVCTYYVLALNLGGANLSQALLNEQDVGERCFGIVEDAAKYIENHVSKGLSISPQLLRMMNGADHGLAIFAERDPLGHGSQFNVINGFVAKTFIYLDDNIAVNRGVTDPSDVNISVRHSDGFWRYEKADRPIPISSIRNAKRAIQKIIDSGEALGGQVSPESAKFVEFMGFTVEESFAYTNAHSPAHKTEFKANLSAAAEAFLIRYEGFRQAFSHES
jgi:hypothetical protein